MIPFFSSNREILLKFQSRFNLTSISQDITVFGDLLVKLPFGVDLSRLDRAQIDGVVLN
jgi:hypothetical protein